MKIKTLSFFIVVLIESSLIHGAFAQETAGAVLAKLTKLSPEARQKALVDGARGEKELTFYSSLQPPQIEPFVRPFQKHFPFLKVNSVRISGSKVVVRAQSEMNAGRHLVDVINASGEEAAALKKVGTL